MPIQYKIGDATRPEGNGLKVIAHICNDVGAWGAGFVMAISKRWMEPRERYMALSNRTLGGVEFVPVAPDIFVANIIGQHGLGCDDGNPPIRYDAVRDGLRKVSGFAKRNGCSVHIPRIGCGLAGGTWDKIEPIIAQELIGIDVTVYDLP